jgi:hypothetical protein
VRLACVVGLCSERARGEFSLAGKCNGSRKGDMVIEAIEFTTSASENYRSNSVDLANAFASKRRIQGQNVPISFLTSVHFTECLILAKGMAVINASVVEVFHIF